MKNANKEIIVFLQKDWALAVIFLEREVVDKLLCDLPKSGILDILLYHSNAKPHMVASRPTDPWVAGKYNIIRRPTSWADGAHNFGETNSSGRRQLRK